jgi:O-antigen/teichoic acid export membrane protein
VSGAPPDPEPDPTDVLDESGAGGRAVGGGALRVVAYVIGSLVAVGSTAVVSRHLGTEQFGSFATVMSLSAIALLVTDFGLATLGVREYVDRTGAERDHVMRVLIGLRMGLMALGAAGMLVFATLAGFSTPLWIGTLLAGIGLIVQAVPATYAVPLHATLRLGWVGGLDLVRQVGQAVALVGFVALGAGIAPLLGSSIVGGLLALVLGAVVARGLAPLVPAWDWAESRRLLRLALSFALATSIGAIYAYAAQVVADLTMTSTESGLFALSFRVFSVVIATALIAVSSAYPILTRAAGDDEARFGYAGSRLYEAVVLFGVAGAVAIGVGSQTIVALLGGDAFREAIDVLRVHSVAIVGSFAVAAGSFMLLSQQRFRELLVINVSVLASSLALTWAMASAWEGVGAALAMNITEFGLAIAYFVVLRRHTDVRPELRRFVGIAIAVVAAVGVALVLGTVAGSVPWNVVVTGVSMAVFTGVALVARGVPDELLAPVRQRLRRG